MGNVAKDIRVYVDQYNISSAFKSAKPSASVDMLDSTTFGASGAHTFNAGLKNATLQLEGFFDFDNVLLNRIDNVLQAALTGGAPHVVTVASLPTGDLLGNRAILLSANEAKYDVDSVEGQLITSMAELQSASGYDSGIFLHPLQAETATGNAASQDNGTSSAGGGVAHLHIPAASGTTPTITVKVQHSTDNITFVDLVTFNAATGAGVQRVELAAGTTVNRYVRVTFTIGGTTPSFTFAVAFARR
ncbi:MAG TPA: hypothetical protein VFA21_20555 [Pyrinomonadaceae bacterium]|nr:hypothetical protein [Pyrinomonadaceae bacterium]